MSGLLARMGITFNSNTLKVKLKMAVSRMQLNQNKLNNQLTVERKQVATLLNQHKDETARIRVEGIIHNKNLIHVMEILSLMCELLSTRIALVNASDTCPSDLEESIASIIYCSQRLDNVPELSEVSDQWEKKYGKQFIVNHINNDSRKVNPRIVDKLNITPPDFELVLQNMEDIAKQYDVEWKPDLEQLSATDHHVASDQDIYRLGAIAGMSNRSQPPQQLQQPQPPAQQQQPQQAFRLNQATSPPPQQQQYYPAGESVQRYKGPDSTGLYPGQLTIQIHAVEDLVAPPNFVIAGLIVAVKNYETESHWRSQCVFASTPGGGSGGSSQPVSKGTFVFQPAAVCTVDVSNGMDKLSIEIRGSAGDTLLGATTVNADTIRRSTQQFHFPVYREQHSGMSGQSGSVVLSSDFMPSNNSAGAQPPPPPEYNESDNLNVNPPSVGNHHDDITHRTENFLNPNPQSADALQDRLNRLAGR